VEFKPSVHEHLQPRLKVGELTVQFNKPKMVEKIFRFEAIPPFLTEKWLKASTDRI